MATAQVADVSLTITSMDAPKEVQDAANNTSWLSGWAIAGFAAGMTWLGNKLFGWLFKRGETYVKRVEDAVDKIEAHSLKMEELQLNDVKILAQIEKNSHDIAEIKLVQEKIKGKIGME